MIHTLMVDFSAYEMTPDKVFQPSTEHDYNVNDLSSGDETDNEDNPRKKVPSWAEKSTLRAHVSYFGRIFDWILNVGQESVSSCEQGCGECLLWSRQCANRCHVVCGRPKEL